MKYAHLLDWLARQPLALHPDKIRAIHAALRLKMAGESTEWDGITNHGGVHYLAHDARIPPQRASAIARAKGRVAVLPVRGVLTHRMGSLEESSGNTTYERLSRTLRSLQNDAEVKAIVLDIHSPGGVTDGVIEMAAEMRAQRGGAKPLVASVNAQAASAAYWLAAQADEIDVTPSGAVGSIGVWTMHEDITGWLEQTGIRDTLISSGKYKTEGNPYEPLGDEARAHLQSEVDAFHDLFIADVAAGRRVSAATVREHFGQGRMVLATEAVVLGMADRVASLEATLNRYGASLHGQDARQRAQDARRELRALRA